MKLGGYVSVVRGGMACISTNLLRNKQGSLCFSSSPATTGCSVQVIPKTPLFLRPPTFQATLTDLKKWHAWAQTLASSVGSSFVHLDNGPDSALLCRELRWLLEDSLQDNTFIISQMGSAQDSNLEGVIVPLRLSLDELYELWRQRIEERRPFQYLVGCEHWRELVLCVQEGVLIPRPETELVVDIVRDVVKDLDDDDDDDGIWADVGTGSGAIAIGIARILGHYNKGRVIATDVSPVAVSVANFNLHRYGLKDKIEVREGSWFEPLKDVEGKLAGLVSNPPYIPSDDIPGLQAEVGRHEPGLALDGGSSGMDYLLHLINGAATMLRIGGFFAFETNGEKQCKFLVEYLENNYKSSFHRLNVVPDFAGIQRFVTGFHR